MYQSTYRRFIVAAFAFVLLPWSVLHADSIWVLDADTPRVVEFAVMVDPISGVATSLTEEPTGAIPIPASFANPRGLAHAGDRLYFIYGAGGVINLAQILLSDREPVDVGPLPMGTSDPIGDRLAFSNGSLFLAAGTQITKIDLIVNAPPNQLVTIPESISSSCPETSSIVSLAASNGQLLLITNPGMGLPLQLHALGTNLTIDPTDMTCSSVMLASIPTDNQMAMGLAFNGRRIYAVAADVGPVFVGDPGNGACLNECTGLSLTPGITITALTSPAARSVFAVNPGAGTIDEFDVSSEPIVALPALPLPPDALIPALTPAGLAYSGRSLYFVNGSSPSNKIYELSLVTGAEFEPPFFDSSLLNLPADVTAYSGLAFVGETLYALGRQTSTGSVVVVPIDFGTTPPVVKDACILTGGSAGGLAPSDPLMDSDVLFAPGTENVVNEVTATCGSLGRVNSAEGTISGLAYDRSHLYIAREDNTTIKRTDLSGNEPPQNPLPDFGFSPSGLASIKKD